MSTKEKQATPKAAFGKRKVGTGYDIRIIRSDQDDYEFGGICQAVLTAGEAARYTYENVVREGDNWDPKKYMEQISAPENLKRENGILSWDASKYAICYLVIANDETVQITKETSCNVEEGKTYQVKAVSEYGSLSEPSKE